MSEKRQTRAKSKASAAAASTASTLSTPVTSRRRPVVNFDSDAVGRVSESIARFFGTGRYLMIQTVIVVVWVIINVGFVAFRFDPYPFILLNLAFSTQAAYAAPLILLAQNRQEDRDKVSLEEDRLRSTQTKADTEFITRELASVRLTLGETVSRDYLRREIDDVKDALARIESRLLSQESDADGADEGRGGDDGHSVAGGGVEIEGDDDRTPFAGGRPSS